MSYTKEQQKFRYNNDEEFRQRCIDTAKRYRDRNREKVRAANKKWRRNNRVSYNNSISARRKITRYARREIERRYRLKYRERVKAGNTLRYHIYNGKIKRPNCCEQCGKTTSVEGHHEDYTKPLQVKWYCHACHMRVHHPNKLCDK